MQPTPNLRSLWNRQDLFLRHVTNVNYRVVYFYLTLVDLETGHQLKS